MRCFPSNNSDVVILWGGLLVGERERVREKCDEIMMKRPIADRSNANDVWKNTSKNEADSCASKVFEIG